MKHAALLLGLVACTAPATARLPDPTRAPATVLETETTAEPPSVTAAEAGVDPARLAALDDEARRTHSDSLVLLKDGRLLWHGLYTPEARRPIETMSITKSVCALAAAMLVDDGALSFETPLTRFFPEWKQGHKQDITLLHLLTHTSGLQDTDDTSEIWPSPDFVQLALTAELTTLPGAVFHYNNKASNLVAEVVQRAGHRRIDWLLRERLFSPLGISQLEWLKDPSGHATCQSGLKLTAIDLARIGELLRRGGRTADGARLVSEASVHRLTHRASTLQPKHGLFFWIPDSGHGFAARGYLGQSLLVLPARGVVAVRLRHWSPTATSGPDDFADFEHRIEELFGPSPHS